MGADYFARSRQAAQVRQCWRRMSPSCSRIRKAPLGSRLELLRIVEKLLFDDAIVLPALIRQLVEPDPLAIKEFELENPSNDDVVAIDEHRTHAFRIYRARSGQSLSFVRDQRLSSDAGRKIVLLHRRMRRVELLDRLHMGVRLDSGDEALKYFGRRHGRSR